MRTINHSHIGPVVQWLRYVPCTCKGFTLNNQPEKVIGEPITPRTDEIRVRFSAGPFIFSVIRVSYLIFTYQGEQVKWQEMKMNQIARAKILEIIVNGKPQFNAHLDVNGGIRVSKIRNKGDSELTKYILNHTAMLNLKTKYEFSYELYKTTLDKSIKKALPDYGVSIKEKQLDESIQKLLDRQYSQIH